jgi:NAD(P)-dependent dehydrogenase (short-subunit alcohol dehydrogenase family)
MMNILISGSSGYIGKYFTNKLINEGHIVIPLDICNNDNPVDVCNETQLIQYLELIKEQYNKVDVFINCIGIPNTCNSLDATDISEITTESFKRFIDINLTAVFVLMREFIRIFKESQGNIINISSMYSVVSPRLDLYNGFIKHPGYIASKTGLVGLTKYIAILAAKYKIKVNCVAPGGIADTEGVEGEFLKKYNKNVPLGSAISLDDVYQIIKMLLTNRSITGQNIQVDGGYTLW